MSPKVFWAMDPYEFKLAMEGKEIDRQHDLEMAWLNARLTQCDPRRFPSLETLIKGPKVYNDEEKDSIREMMKRHREMALKKGVI